MSFSTPPTVPVPSWQSRALDRSLAETRARSVERLGQFVDAARDLATETASPDFTVQQIVVRAGLSLKSFYRYFEGKDDLLFALLEEDSRVGASLLAAMVEEQREPADRLHAYIDGLFQFLVVGPRGYVSVLVREHRRLSLASPDKMRAALAPFHELLERELTAAEAVGVVRSGDFRRDAITVFDLVLSNFYDVVLGPDDVDPDSASRYVWEFCWSGLAPRETATDEPAANESATDVPGGT
jgi:AcrR family transcriptional regulator